MLEEIREGRQRVVIEGLSPRINDGEFPLKRVIGEEVTVEADLFADGHDAISGVLKYRRETESDWTEVPLEFLVNDRWTASFTVTGLGRYYYTIEGWVDGFKSWRRDLEKKVKAGLEVGVELQAGAKLIEEAAGRAKEPDADLLREQARLLATGGSGANIQIGLSEALFELAARYPDRRFASVYSRELEICVDPVLARFGAWYEMFPRSCAGEPGRHGTFKDCERHLARVAQMGFDILYLPPIHPIGRTYRKGPNNKPTANPGDPGSPWGIGGEEGGHKSIHPELGTLEDFRAFVKRAEEHNIKIALDIAFQCSPDHPYVREHPEWFRKRPDGSIQYAENPPKKYQDIYPLDFETEDWRGLWRELKSVFEFWIEQGVTIFRVDNPHTKAFPFWEWLVPELKRKHPELILLSEAFTRPKVMNRLAKLGYTQSYNYFPWRNTREELTEYLTELTQTESREYFRPNLWPNTPDILTQYLQYGGRPAFMARFVLAATLGASYGIYGPAFELCENTPRERGSEEYLHSEKYEIRHWDLNAPGNLTELIGAVNRIRRENPALHRNESLLFHKSDNDQIIAYSKTTDDLENIILAVVNLDPHHKQSGWIDARPPDFGIGSHDVFQVHDLLTDARYIWNAAWNYVELDPRASPAHIFRVRKRVRTEQDFETFM